CHLVPVPPRLRRMACPACHRPATSTIPLRSQASTISSSIMTLRSSPRKRMAVTDPRVSPRQRAADHPLRSVRGSALDETRYPMRYRPLGDSGLMVSVTGLGCNNFGRRLDLDATRAVVNAALEAGVTLLDTSDTYGNGGGSEELLGEVLAGRRDEVVLATKFGHQDYDMGYGPAAGAKGGRAYIRRAVERSLRRLRTD